MHIKSKACLLYKHTYLPYKMDNSDCSLRFSGLLVTIRLLLAGQKMLPNNITILFDQNFPFLSSSALSHRDSLLFVGATWGAHVTLIEACLQSWELPIKAYLIAFSSQLNASLFRHLVTFCLRSFELSLTT